MAIRLYLDDLRACPDGWTLARSVDEAKRMLVGVEVSHASLDHDLGGACDGACWDDEGDNTKRLCAPDCG